MNFKIKNIVEFFTIPINDNTTELKSKYAFLTKQTWTQYFSLDNQAYPQLILNVKFNHITKGLDYQFLSIENQKLSNPQILQEGFLISMDLFLEIAPYQIYFINNTFFLVEVECIQGAYFFDLEKLHQQNIKALYNEKI